MLQWPDGEQCQAAGRLVLHADLVLAPVLDRGLLEPLPIRVPVVALALRGRVLHQAECHRQAVHVRGSASGRCPPEALPDTVLSRLALLAQKTT
eukprot:14064087-Heterocapsa_arctica.AAC.1